MSRLTKKQKNALLDVQNVISRIGFMSEHNETKRALMYVESAIQDFKSDDIKRMNENLDIAYDLVKR